MHDITVCLFRKKMTDKVFVDSAACGDLDAIKEFLKDPSFLPETINMIDKDGKSAFHYACLNDDVPLLATLLADPRVDVKLTSPHGDTGLHMSSLYAALEAMKLLFVDKRIGLNSQNKFGETPLHLCAGSGDKGASKATHLLLEAGASLLVTDKWGRCPLDVSRDNAENPIMKVLNEWLDTHPEERVKCDEITKKYKNDQSDFFTEQNAAKMKAKNAIFGALGNNNNNNNSGGGAGGNIFAFGNIKLKKTTVVEKTMFKADEGDSNGSKKHAHVTVKPGCRALSKLIDFPGDAEEIKKYLDDPTIDPAGTDSYGLTALHKFASWNKTIYIDLIIPKLTIDEINAKCPDGKTALHWAVEMAAVGSIKSLIQAGINIEAKDNKDRTVVMILDQSEPSTIIDRLRAALKSH